VPLTVPDIGGGFCRRRCVHGRFQGDNRPCGEQRYQQRLPGYPRRPFLARFLADYFTLFAKRAHRTAPNQAPLRTVKKGMPHEVATSLVDFECADFGMAGSRRLAPAKSQKSICRGRGHGCRRCANAGEPHSRRREGRWARSPLK
jgi:hypothetical protein